MRNHKNFYLNSYSFILNVEKHHQLLPYGFIYVTPSNDAIIVIIILVSQLISLLLFENACI